MKEMPSDVIRKSSLSNVETIAFKDWWHLLARYTSVIEGDDTIRTALRIMTHRGFRHLPVVSDGKLVGIISAGDLIDIFVTEEEKSKSLLSTLNKRISLIANQNPITIKPNNTILDAIRTVSEKNLGSLLIIEDETIRDVPEKATTKVTSSSSEQETSSKKLVGIVTLRDLVSILAAYSPFGVRVEDCMTGQVATVDKHESILSAMTLMSEQKVRRLPVMSMPKLDREIATTVQGMVTNKMILRYIESMISYEMLEVSRSVRQPVRTVMQSPMPLIDPKEDCGNAAYLMRELGTGGFAVVDSRGLVGVITERDLLRRIYQKEGLSFFLELFEKGNAGMRA